MYDIDAYVFQKVTRRAPNFTAVRYAVPVRNRHHDWQHEPITHFHRAHLLGIQQLSQVTSHKYKYLLGMYSSLLSRKRVVPVRLLSLSLVVNRSNSPTEETAASAPAAATRAMSDDELLRPDMLSSCSEYASARAGCPGEQKERERVERRCALVALMSQQRCNMYDT